MMKGFSVAAVGAIILGGTSATAQKVEKAGKPLSPFILCDGRTGHVGLGETLARLVAITATAGLSEVATRQDDATLIQGGAVAADACATALSQEGDNVRRAQLASARAIHLVEADRLPEALIAIRDVPNLIGPLKDDWGYQHTLAPRIMLIEAEILARMKNGVDAEQVAMRALQAAPYDLAVAASSLRFLLQSDELPAEHEAALRQMLKLAPVTVALVTQEYVSAGRFADADAIFAGMADTWSPFYTSWSGQQAAAYRTVLNDLMNEPAKARDLAERARTPFADGLAASDIGFVATVAELLALHDVLQLLRDGKGQEARTMFRARGSWLLVPRPIIAAAVDQLRVGAPAAELTGALSDNGSVIRTKHRAELLGVFADKKLLSAHYERLTLYTKRSSFGATSGAVWKVSPKPRFVVAPGKDQLPDTVVLSTIPRFDGLPAGQAMMLHAALIARQRGSTGFVMKPGQRLVSIAAVRFGALGAPGFSQPFTFDAAQVIEDLSPQIPMPAAR